MSSTEVTKSQMANAPAYPELPQHGVGIHVAQQPHMVPGPGVTIVQQPTPTSGVIIAGGSMGPKPTGTVCRSCNQQIVTKVEVKTSAKTHVFAVVLCCLFFPCACVPYCVDTCKTAEHYCPNCGAYIGRDSR